MSYCSIICLPLIIIFSIKIGRKGNGRFTLSCSSNNRMAAIWKVLQGLRPLLNCMSHRRDCLGFSRLLLIGPKHFLKTKNTRIYSSNKFLLGFCTISIQVRFYFIMVVVYLSHEDNTYSYTKTTRYLNNISPVMEFGETSFKARNLVSI